MNKPDLKEIIIAVLSAVLVSTLFKGLLHILFFVDFGFDLHLDHWPKPLALLTYLIIKILL